MYFNPFKEIWTYNFFFLNIFGVSLKKLISLWSKACMGITSIVQKLSVMIFKQDIDLL